MPAEAAAASPPSPPRTLISVATYNEIENLPALVEAVRQVAPQADILVIDDNSPDGTGRWCDEQAAAEPRFTACIARASSAWARRSSRRSIRPRARLRLRPQHGRRFQPSSARISPPCWRPWIGGRCYRIAILPRRRHEGLALPAPVDELGRQYLRPLAARPQAQRLQRRLSLLSRFAAEEARFSTIKSRGYSFQEEILWRLKRVGARFAEMPIVFADRERGQSKINKQEALSALWIIFRLGVTNWIGL